MQSGHNSLLCDYPAFVPWLKICMSYRCQKQTEASRRHTLSSLCRATSLGYSSPMHYAVIDSPMGPLTVASTEKGIASIHFGESLPEGAVSDPAANHETVEQLTRVLPGQENPVRTPARCRGDPISEGSLERTAADSLRGDPFLWRDRKAVGKPGAARAVGMANHDNPIAVVIPCHRVVGQDGSLTGYAGGIHLKEQLLSIERRHRTLFT